MIAPICLVVAYLLTRAIVPPTRGLMVRLGHVKSNYAGRSVPYSMGVPLVVSACLASVVVPLAAGGDLDYVVPCLVVVAASALAGLVDDVFGSAESRGLSGHVAALVRRGVLTTGVLKGVVILAFAALAVRMAAPTLHPGAHIMDSGLIALAANFSNLLDLRPGRAAKAYLVSAAALSALTGLPGPALLPVGLAGAVLAGAKDDLAERTMLGDAGSNPLGAALGFWLVSAFPFAARALALVGLVLVHAYAERHSMTTLIEGNRLLRLLDALGRK